MRQGQLFGFTAYRTTQTVYKIQYMTGHLCHCGKYSIKDQESITGLCDSRLNRLNFTVEISVERVRNQWGENCSFSLLFFGDKAIDFDLRVLTENISTFTVPSLSTSDVLSSSTTPSSVTADDREKMEKLPTGTLNPCVLFSVYGLQHASL